MTEETHILRDRRADKPVCTQLETIHSLVSDRDGMKKTMEGVSTKLDLILAQITKVAILEERHTNSVTDINRAHMYIANLEKETKALSVEVRDFISYSKGVARTAWAVWSLLAGTVLMLLVKILFFMGAHGVTG
jgi:hypothetical protein